MGIHIAGIRDIIIKPLTNKDLPIEDKIDEYYEKEEVIFVDIKRSIIYLQNGYSEDTITACGGPYSDYDELLQFLYDTAIELDFTKNNANFIRYFPLDGLYDTSKCKIVYYMLDLIIKHIETNKDKYVLQKRRKFYDIEISYKKLLKVFEFGSDNGCVVFN